MLMNFFAPYDWNTILNEYPPQTYSIKAYHQILCPRSETADSEYPDFLDKYIALPLLQRLQGVGLLCGTDWTKLYKNRFYYSRLDHSIGVALIIWHFTKDKAQTIAGLLHDVSTPVFSHVSDFRKGDALTQTATEEDNAGILHHDSELAKLLAADGLTIEQVEDYHKYPVADNEIPQLSADRLEYMFPSGMALCGCWTMEEIERCYNDLTILKNEDGLDELGFKTLETAELYCERFCMIGHILQLNENKLTLQLLGQIMNRAVEQKVLSEDDFMALSEKEIIEKLEAAFMSFSGSPRKSNIDDDFLYLKSLYQTFRTMTQIEHTNAPLPESEYYNVSLNVKQRYINPLVQMGTDSATSHRLSEVSAKSRRIIEDFLAYKDTKFGCVKIKR
ncbi:MAG: hypothetical protein K6A43_10320 [Treponema sp.]|nr:hypothetical protein [Treponema sp.]